MSKLLQNKTWNTSVALAVAVYAVCKTFNAPFRMKLALVCLAAYLPSYLDGAEYTGKRHWPWFASFMRKYKLSIPMTIEFEEPLDTKKQLMFCSHPHGLLSAHHGALLSNMTEPGGGT